MAYRSEPELVALHVLRLKGLAGVDAVARAGAFAVDDAAAVVEALAAAGLVARRDGRLSGWSLTDEGRVAHAARLDEELEASGQREHVDLAYRSFLEVNGDMLGACTAWQLRGEPGSQVVNDHSDVAWDDAVLARLVGLHRRAQPVLDELGGTLERLAGYRPRLDAAQAHVLAGDHEWFTKPSIDSYHTTWFELHEDLLRTLGLERASEARRVLQGRR